MKGNRQIKKAIAITDAKIQFVSLVDKAANKCRFLITKGEEGKAQLSTLSKILKVDNATHYVTGIVYEPMKEDAHGNYMTEEEVRKAAYWFAKHGDQVDIQHSFTTAENVAVVESYITPCPMVLEGVTIAKGSWLMTAEICDEQIWEAVAKGEITGFSMGGIGNYSEEDVDLEIPIEKRGILKRLSDLLGFDVVEKGALADSYNEQAKGACFWSALQNLEQVLYPCDNGLGGRKFEQNEGRIKEALEDFSAIITDLLNVKETGALESTLAEGRPVNKAGKKMSAANMGKLQSIVESLQSFMTEFENRENQQEIDKEETEVTREEIQEMIDAAVEAALKPKEEKNQEKKPAEVVAKAEPLTGEDLDDLVTKTVAKALAPILQARGLPSNLNDSESIEKSDSVFSGLFM